MKVLVIIVLSHFSSYIYAFVNKTACTGNTYFNTANQNCESCPANQTAVVPNAISCQCANGFYSGFPLALGWNSVCLECPAVKILKHNIK